MRNGRTIEPPLRKPEKGRYKSDLENSEGDGETASKSVTKTSEGRQHRDQRCSNLDSQADGGHLRHPGNERSVQFGAATKRRQTKRGAPTAWCTRSEAFREKKTPPGLHLLVQDRAYIEG